MEVLLWRVKIFTFRLLGVVVVTEKQKVMLWYPYMALIAGGSVHTIADDYSLNVVFFSKYLLTFQIILLPSSLG
jgi:hypothetical protein